MKKKKKLMINILLARSKQQWII